MSSAARQEFDALINNQDPKSNRHPEDLNDVSASDDDNDNDNDSTTLPSPDEHSDFEPTTMPSAVCHLPTSTFDANTGPKGVIADALSFEKARKRGFRQTLRALSDAQASLFGYDKNTSVNLSHAKSASTDGRGTDDDDSDEDQFMRTWRTNRMTELQSMGQDIRTRRQSPSERKYGSLDTVDASGYLDAIDKVPIGTVTIVCIYDDQSPTSGMVEDALQKLAHQHATRRFVKLHYLEADMDEISVPAVLVYKDGELIANLISVMEEIPPGQEMSSSVLETMLKQHQILL